MTTTAAGQIKARKGDFIAWNDDLRITRVNGPAYIIKRWRVGVVVSTRAGEARGVAEPGYGSTILRPGTRQAVAPPARLRLPPAEVAAAMAVHTFEEFNEVVAALAEFAVPEKEPSA